MTMVTSKTTKINRSLACSEQTQTQVGEKQKQNHDNTKPAAFKHNATNNLWVREHKKQATVYEMQWLNTNSGR